MRLQNSLKIVFQLSDASKLCRLKPMTKARLPPSRDLCGIAVEKASIGVVKYFSVNDAVEEGQEEILTLETPWEF